MKTIIPLFILITINIITYGQEKYVAITMDDLFFAFGNADIDEIENACDTLLNIVAKQNIPVTVFVNEKSFIKNGECDRRLSLVNKWIEKPLITIGNHTYSHLNYAKTELEAFEEDIIRNEAITNELLKKANKPLKYFRFPFNSCGRDSASKEQIYKFLNHKGYTVTPFTIESMDYMFNTLYCNFLKNGNLDRATKIEEQYVDFTLNLFDYFEGLTNDLYGRRIKHIFLCHTNLLNAACLDNILIRLHEKGYNFISLEDALEDEIYQCKDYYNKKYGISWIYRWINDSEERKKLLRNEPYPEEIEQLYNNLTNKQ